MTAVATPPSTADLFHAAMLEQFRDRYRHEFFNVRGLIAAAPQFAGDPTRQSLYARMVTVAAHTLTALANDCRLIGLSAEEVQETLGDWEREVCVAAEEFSTCGGDDADKPVAQRLNDLWFAERDDDVPAEGGL